MDGIRIRNKYQLLYDLAVQLAAALGADITDDLTEDGAEYTVYKRQLEELISELIKLAFLKIPGWPSITVAIGSPIQ